MEARAEVVFELSWEVCNKVGGIYTVVKSKAAQMVKRYDEYFLVGPYFPSQQPAEFAEEMPHEFCREGIEDLKKEGIICHFGKWLIDGNPNVILIDFESMKGKANEIKKDLWEHYRIDSIRAAYDYDEPLAWSYAAGKVIERLSQCHKSRKIVAHCHEWLAGAALLYLKARKAPVATVFTTHATTLGRTLATADVELYSIWDKIDADFEAKRHGVEAKHSLEKACAHSAEVFTTVSEITSMEAGHLLGKEADVLVLNGLDIEKFPTHEDIAIKHNSQKHRIKQFLVSYFFPYYDFDLNSTLIYFIAARYEFKNKGLDVLLEGLAKLNERLKAAKSPKTIVVFIFVPANIRNIKPEVLENRTYYQDIKDAIDDVKDESEQNLVNSLLSGKKISQETIFDKAFLLELKNKLKRFQKKGNPPVCTHDMQGQDIILSTINRLNLSNQKDDPVKMIYYPTYLTGADHLLNLDYNEVVGGSHLGIFPSYYEPWGYTPLEAGAVGVASVTTDLSGFGRFFCQECVQGKAPGIFVLNRMNKTYDEVVNHLTNIMFDFQELSKLERNQNKIQARKIAAMADWKIFIENYIEAHNKAVDKAYPNAH